MPSDSVLARLDALLVEELRPARHLRKELEALLGKEPDPLLERLHALVSRVSIRTSPYYARMIGACVVLAQQLDLASAHELVDHVAETTKQFHLVRR